MTTERTDELLTVFAQQHESVETLMESFFGFLHRRSDLYVVTKDPKAKGMGFCPGQAEQVVEYNRILHEVDSMDNDEESLVYLQVIKAFRKYSMVNGDASECDEKAKAKATSSTRTSQAGNSSAAKPTVSKQVAPPERPSVSINANGKQVPVENGGATERYVWTQTLEDVTLQVELPVGTRSKDIECNVQAKHLSVAIKAKTSSSSAQVLIDGDLPYRVRTDECLWSIENGQTLTISLEKIEATWWASALQGDAEIDTSAVDSTRALHSYDPAVQGAVQKAMFDMRQQQQGLPTSEELKMQELLDKAKRAPNSPF